MLASVSKKISRTLAVNDIIPDEDEASYAYSLEILLATVMNFAVLLVTALCFGRLVETLLFSAGFVPFRMLNGGYHAKTHWGCMLMLLLFEAVLFSTIILNVYMYCLPFVFVLSFLLFSLNTMNASANILSDNRKRLLKRKSRILLVIYFTLLLITAVFTDSFLFQYCVVFGLASSAFSILLAKFVGKNQQVKR